MGAGPDGAKAMSSDESRLGRWARRKAEARNRRGGATPVLDKEPVEKQPLKEPADALPGEAAPVERLPEGAELPDIESLDADSDFSAFMKEGVPQALRRLALRKLWASDPMFNVIDEMVEYGEDYTNAGMIVEGIKSAWEPGRGYARDDEKSPTNDTDDTDTSEAITSEAMDLEAQPAAEAEFEQDELRGTATTEIAEDESEEDPELG